MASASRVHRCEKADAFLRTCRGREDRASRTTYLDTVSGALGGIGQGISSSMGEAGHGLVSLVGMSVGHPRERVDGVAVVLQDAWCRGCSSAGRRDTSADLPNAEECAS
jgi:hypothetical protein